MPLSAPLTRPAGRRRGRALAGSIAAALAALRADRGGAIAAVFALSLPAIIGFAGLGTEAASWYLTKRTMQGAADSAAAAAATALAAGAAGAVLAGEARSIAAYYHFVDGSDGTTVAVNSPPASGAYRNNPNAVEVAITRRTSALLSALFLSQGPTIGARAVAVANRSLTAEACVVALDSNSETAMTASGTAVALNFPTCSLYINSPYTSALDLNGQPTIIPKTAYIVGSYNDPHNSLQPVSGTYTGVTPLTDPYKTVTIPAYSGCNDSNYKMSGGKSATKSAGTSGVYVFCNGIDLTGNSSLTLGAGTFIIDRGTLKIASGSTLRATSGTTIILTTSTGSGCATVQFNGQANIGIVAPTSGSLAGIAIYKDRACVNRSSADDKLAGGSSQSIKGAIYFPEQYIEFAGGSATGGAICTQLIAWKIKFSGNSGFQSNCADAGTRKLVVIGGNLVE
jgi:Flp pilus assembly protein TadG